MLAAVLLILVLLCIAGWEIFCLIQIPLGGVLYLLIGRVWIRNATR
jgi:hypothetical protein